VSFSLAQHGRRVRPRVAAPGELSAALDFCQAQGANGVMAGARIEILLRTPAPMGEVWVLERRGARPAGAHLRADHIEALAWAGGNLIPVGADEVSGRAFGEMASARGARYHTVVGEATGVMAVWQVLEPIWQRPRSVRPNQPCMVALGPPLVEADTQVRPASLRALDALVPACRAMFTEELGFPPPGPEPAYRAHVAAQVGRGSILARLTRADGRVIFKAELGSQCGSWVQVQGVWTDPVWRGQGIGKAGMAAVVAEAKRRGLVNVCLYVNDFNTPALAVYRAVGFAQVSTWATIMY
jgi:predicted GNAT family acetyltransferase